MITDYTATAEDIQVGWLLNAPDQWDHLRVDRVERVGGGGIRISGQLTKSANPAVYVFAADDPVVCKYEDSGAASNK